MKIRNKVRHYIYSEEHFRMISDGKGKPALRKSHTMSGAFIHKGIFVKFLTPSRTYAGKHYMWARHRIGGPALINHMNDGVGWFVMGVAHYFTRQYCEACKFSNIKTMQWILKYGRELPEYVNQL